MTGQLYYLDVPCSDTIAVVPDFGPFRLYRPSYVRRMAAALEDVPVYAVALENFREVRARRRLKDMLSARRF